VETATLAIELPKSVEKRLQAVAKKAGRNASDLAIEAIAERIEDYEDAIRGLERLKEDDGTRIPLSEIIKDIEELERKDRAAKPAAE
jgi:RHH-type transcriptional regulator, rel operon repressor / antitoxin RelB